MEELIKEAIELEQKQREIKKELDRVKAEIQQIGLQELEDKNVKAVSYYAKEGEVIVMETQSLDVLNVEKLKTYFEGVWDTKVSEEKKTVYKYDKNFERALKSIFTEDYTFECTLSEFLDQMQVRPDAKQKALLLKKLKGDFVKDRNTLNSVLGERENGFYDVELWYIYKIKNAELISSFLPDANEDTLSAIRRFMIVTDKTSITLNYDKE